MTNPISATAVVGAVVGAPVTPAATMSDEDFDFLLENPDVTNAQVPGANQSQQTQQIHQPQVPAPQQVASPQPQPQPQPQPVAADTGMLAQMQAQLAALQQQNMLLMQQQQQSALAAQMPVQQRRQFVAPSVSMRDLEATLTAEQREIYRDMGPLIDAMARVQSERYSQALTPLLDELDTLRGQTAQFAQGVEQRIASQGVTAFNATLNAALPDMAATVATPAWAAYLRETVPLTGGKTVANVLMEAHNGRDLAQISEVYRAFQSRNAASAKPPGVQPAAGSAGVAPAQAAVAHAAQQVQAGGTPAISEAKIDELTRRYQQGLISHAAYTRAMDQLTELALTGAAFK